MSFHKQRILPMKESPERELMTFFLEQVKRTKGLTTVLDRKAGINGKWLKPDEAYNINSSRLLRAFIYKAINQTHDDFEKDVTQFIDFIYHLIKKNFCRDLPPNNKKAI